MPRRPKQFIFELHDDAPEPPSPPRRNKGRRKGKQTGSEAPVTVGVGGAGNGAAAWASVSFDGIADLVPQLPKEYVRSVCADERAAGASPEHVIDMLLNLSLQPQQRPQLQPSPPPPPQQQQQPTPAPPPALTPPAAIAEAPLLASLPDEILGALFLQLGFACAGRVRRVCRALQDAGTRYLTQVRKLHCTRSYKLWHDDRLLGLIRACPSVEFLALEGGVNTHGPSASGWAPGFDSWTALLRPPSLGVPGTLWNLRTLNVRSASSLGEAHVRSLALCCPALRALQLKECTGLTDRAVIGIAALRQLQELELSHSPQVSCRALQALLRCAAGLRKADFSHGGEGLLDALGEGGEASPHTPRSPRRTPSATSRPTLREKVGSGAGSSSEPPSSCAGAGAAETREAELDVDEQVMLAFSAPLAWDTPVPLRLVEWSLAAWRSLKSLELESAPQLATLCLASCPALTSVKLDAPSLKELNASKCEKLAAVLLACPRLESLKLSSCSSLARLETASPSAHLAAANLFGCRSLSTEALTLFLDRCAAALRTLNLNGAVGTGSLAEDKLRLACPNLTELDARGRARKHGHG